MRIEDCDDLGGVLSYSVSGSRGVHGQSMGADGAGDFCILIFGDKEMAEKKAREIILAIRSSGKIISFASFVPNDPLGSWGGNPIKTVVLGP